jgi:acetyl esterase/lipase
VLVGDSAGGNMILGLTLKLIQDKDVIPDGLFPIYPVVRMQKSIFSPSFFHCFFNTFLPLRNLFPIIELYTRTEKDYESPFVNPISAPESLLRQLPPMEIAIGGSDFLFDDNMRFIKRLTYSFLLEFLHEVFFYFK